uniref:PDZ domain-containing protein n=1 Tax=Junco hyemalis TaxID=40217 RepID=A0A8C5J436_JUNHY
MSKGLKKKSHWTSRVHEIVIVRNPEGQLGFELKGGAENGQFPYLGEVKPGKVAYEGGSKLVPEELLLEVNETPVAGLTIRDVLAVIKHCKDPIRLKCVKQGKAGTGPPPCPPPGGRGRSGGAEGEQLCCCKCFADYRCTWACSQVFSQSGKGLDPH